MELDWHGHNDRGHALPLALFALEQGVDRVHGCGLGIGERVGNTSMDLLLLNLYLLGQLDAEQHDLSCLVEYVNKVSEYTEVPIHPAYPLSGRDAFRTATGVHAAAVIKAEKKGELDLADRTKNLPGQLSGGQKQRVAIGRALMNEPMLVLFDEPTSALDTDTGSQVMELIRSEMKSRGTAAIVVTHDERITEYCDRTVHIVDGVLAA